MRSGLVCKTASSVNSEMRSQADGSGNSIFRRTGYDAGELGLIFPLGKKKLQQSSDCKLQGRLLHNKQIQLHFQTIELTGDLGNP